MPRADRDGAGEAGIGIGQKQRSRAVFGEGARAGHVRRGERSRAVDQQRERAVMDRDPAGEGRCQKNRLSRPVFDDASGAPGAGFDRGRVEGERGIRIADLEGEVPDGAGDEAFAGHHTKVSAAAAGAMAKASTANVWPASNATAAGHCDCWVRLKTVVTGSASVIPPEVPSESMA
jgi:hypothetical protein